MKALLVALVLAATACSGSDGVSLKDLPNQLLDAACKADVKCGFMPDLATCKAAYQANDTYMLTIEAAAAAKEVKYDEGLGKSCVDEEASYTCEFTGLQPTPNDPCVKMFTGLVAAGGACFASTECAGGGACTQTDPNCDATTTCCPGTCAAAPTKVAIGQACQSSGDCVDGAYCSQATMTCKAVVTQEGSACDDFYACANPMLCNLDFTTGMFTTCYTPAARTATCDPNTILPCSDSRDYCDSGTMKCTPVATTGQACAGTGNVSCAYYDTCTNSMCTANPGANQACMADQFGLSNCLGSLACTSGTCQLPGAMTCQ